MHTTLAVILVAGYLVSGAKAGSIGLKFTNDPNGPLSTTDSPGIVSGQNWNIYTTGFCPGNQFPGQRPCSPVGVSLKDNLGSPTGALLSYSGSDHAYDWNSASGYEDCQSSPYPCWNLATTNSATNVLYSGGLVGGGGTPMIITLSNIPYASYQLITYSSDPFSDGAGVIWKESISDGTTSYWIGGSLTPNTNVSSLTLTTSVNQLAPQAGFGQYQVFNEGTSSVSITINGPEGVNTFLYGLQILETSPVPEPSTVASLASGLLLMAGIVFRRRQG